MKTLLKIIALILAGNLYAQEAQVAPLDDLSILGITNLQFTANVRKGKVFVMEMKVLKDDQKLYIYRTYSTQKKTKINMPIFDTLTFFQPQGNNQIIFKTPSTTFIHKNARLEGTFGGKEFSFRITEMNNQNGKIVSVVYTYEFKCFMQSLADSVPAVQKLPPGVIFLAAEKG